MSDLISVMSFHQMESIRSLGWSFSLTSSLCVWPQIQSVLLWNVASGVIENVGDVGSGIRAMSWSPDQEILVLATGT